MFNVVLLGITSLLTDFSSEMIVPLLPFFIQSLGGSAVAIGLVFGFGDAIAALLRVFSGYWADRTKKYKTFVFFGYLASALAKFGYVGALTWQRVAITRPIERLGKGFRDAPRDAIISESVPQEHRGKAFGIQRAFDSAGAILGSVTVLALFVWLDMSFSTIFFVSACIGLLAVVPVVLVRVPPALLSRQVATRLSGVPPKAKVFIAISTLFAFANFSVAFFILKAQQSFPGMPYKEALGLTLLAYITFNIIDTLFSEPAGALSDRVGRRRVIVTGYILFTFTALGFAFLSSVPALFILFGAYGLFKALIDGSQKAFISDLSPVEVRGTALGFFEALTGLAAIPAGLIAGLLWNISPVYTFSYAAGVALVASILLILAVRRT